MRTAKTLIRLGAHSFCWFCHVVAHLCFTLDGYSTILSLLLYDLVTVSLRSALVSIRTVWMELRSQTSPMGTNTLRRETVTKS